MGMGGQGCTRAVHGRSRITIDPRIMPGRNTSGVKCWASRMEAYCSKN